MSAEKHVVKISFMKITKKNKVVDSSLTYNHEFLLYAIKFDVKRTFEMFEALPYVGK